MASHLFAYCSIPILKNEDHSTAFHCPTCEKVDGTNFSKIRQNSTEKSPKEDTTLVDDNCPITTNELTKEDLSTGANYNLSLMDKLTKEDLTNGDTYQSLIDGLTKFDESKWGQNYGTTSFDKVISRPKKPCTDVGEKSRYRNDERYGQLGLIELCFKKDELDIKLLEGSLKGDCRNRLTRDNLFTSAKEDNREKQCKWYQTVEDSPPTEMTSLEIEELEKETFAVAKSMAEYVLR